MARGQEARKLERQEKALDLRKAGFTFRQIATKLRISKSSAHSLVAAALLEARTLNAGKGEDVRQLEIERLDEMQSGLWPKRKDPRVVDTLVRLSERRSKLGGLDAPEKREHSGAVEVSPLRRLGPTERINGLIAAVAKLPRALKERLRAELAKELPTC